MFSDRRMGYWLAAPAVLLIAFAFIWPIGLLISGAFQDDSGTIGLSRFLEFFGDGLHREVFWRTVRLGATVAVACAVLGYAVSLYLVSLPPANRSRLVGLFVLPLMISPVARTYAWIVILGRTGVVNQFLVGSGLLREAVPILFTETAVFIGLVQLFLPLMVLSLVSALENLPSDVIAAARSLGAGWLTVFFKIVLPLTKEGLVIGGTLVFTGAVTAYITPAVLGGSKVLMLETLLYQRVSVSNDFVAASVIATLLIAMSLVTHMVLKRVTDK